MSAGPDTVSVVIPCYNASPFLRETLESALSQTRPPDEIIVIDDGSVDDSSEIARSYAPDVRVISQENQGESVARNRGIDEAVGTWIAFLDADDIWKPEKLERQLVAAADNGAPNEVVAVHTNIYTFGEQNYETRFQDFDVDVRYTIQHLARHNVFRSPSAMLVRRELSPRFPSWTTHAEDLVYCLELVKRGRIVLVEDPLTGHRQHATNQTKHAATQIGWHTTIRQWMADNAGELSESERQRIDNCWLEKVASAAWNFKAARKWDDYWEVRNYLEQFRGTPAVDLVLSNKIYPRWLYQCKDLLEVATSRNRRSPGEKTARTKPL